MAHEAESKLKVVWGIDSAWFRDDDEIICFFWVCVFEVTACVKWLWQSFDKDRVLTWIITVDVFLWRSVCYMEKAV